MTIIIQLVFLECILSIDNAAVLGAMVANLPEDQKTPWPRWMRGWMGWSDHLLGSQREAALKVGLVGAYLGRAAMLVLASLIIQMPWIHVLGACYLLYLCISHFGERYRHGRAAAHGTLAPRRRSSFWPVVLAIELADLAFSVDNVVAAVALSRELWIVMLGVAIGIPAIRFAASLFTRMIQWEPELESGAYLLLMFIGVKFLLEIWLDLHIDDMLQFGISLLILGLTILFARVHPLRSMLIVLVPVLVLFALVQSGVNLLMGGLSWPLRRLLPHEEEQRPELRVKSEEF